MINEPHGCRTCQNRAYMTNICGLKGQSVSLTSKLEWSDYLKRWGDAVANELANAEKVHKENPTRKNKAEVKRLREEALSIKARPLGRVVENCPHYEQHGALLPPHASREEE